MILDTNFNPAKKYSDTFRGALGALFLLLFFPVAPALAEVSCEALQRGTLGDDGVFTRGTRVTDTDYRVVCRGTGAGANFVGWEDVDAAVDMPGADEMPERAASDPDTRLILEIENAFASFRSGGFPIEDDDRYSIVVLGKVAGDGASTYSGVSFGVQEDLQSDLKIDSHADIHITGGGQGISVFTNDEEPDGAIHVRNFGRVRTEGESPTGRPRGEGIDVYSRGGDVRASNEIGASIETRGAGGRGLQGSSSGEDATVVVVNLGSITTTGEPNDNAGGRTANAVQANAEGLNGTARVVNESGATIRTEGQWARGLHAGTCVWTGTRCHPNGRGTASAINAGSITTKGEGAAGMRARGLGIGTSARAVNEFGATIHTVGERAAGVEVRGEGAAASARAVNEFGATIHTVGERADGMEVGSSGATARSQAENRGTITTTGFRAIGMSVWSNDSTASPFSAKAENWGSVTTAGDRANAINVYSEQGSASAVNHAGGSIVTLGAGSQGFTADTRGAGQTASAVNHGAVTTTGGTYLSEDGSVRREAHGVAAFGNGVGSRARAINEATGTIRVGGDGARGLYADTCAWTGTECDPTGGTALAINRGSVTTTGDRHTYPNGSTRRADAVAAGAHGAGRSQVINEGTVRTEGEDADGLIAWIDGGRGGQSRVENRASGRVETNGDNASFGILGWVGGGSTSSSTEVTNEGSISTRGHESDGMLAVAYEGGTQANPNSLRAVNLTGGTIATEGDGASGVGAHIGVPGTGPTTAYGTGWAENRGIVATTGGTADPNESLVAQRMLSAASGVSASFFTWSDDAAIGNAGDLTVVNTGSVTVTGGSAGLAARTFGTGSATVQMTGGSVTAGATDNSATPEDESGFGIGIFAVVHTDSSSDDPSDDTDIRITVSGTTTKVTAHGGADNPITDTLDESRGIGILAQTGPTGHIEVDVSGGATVTADRAAVFEGGRTTFNLVDGSLLGDLEFASLDDSLTFRKGLIDGDVRFGDGTDTLVFDVADSARITGNITGLERMMKRGTGVAHIADAALPGSALAIEEGELSLRGHLDLGSGGMLTVHDRSRLSVEVGDLTADAADHGRITAGLGVVYEGLADDEAPDLYLQLARDAADNAGAIRTELVDSPIDVLGDDTRVKRQTDTGPVDVEMTQLRTADADGSTREIGSVQKDGVVSLAADATLGAPPPMVQPPPVAERSRSGGGGSDAGLLAVGSGGLIFGALGDEETALAYWQDAIAERRTTTSLGGLRSGFAHEQRVRTGGLEQWTRFFTGDAPSISEGGARTVRGVAMGLDARLSRGFRLGMTAMPELSLSARPGSASLDDTSLEGSHYSFRGGWSGASLFADATVSQGRYRAQALFENPVAGGALGGEFALAQSQVRARAGARIGLGSFRASPSLSLHSGSLQHGAYTAEGSALRADIPGVSQRYEGWKAGLNLTPSGWLEGLRKLRWLPSLDLATTRTRTHGPAYLDVRQSDKVGVLSFVSRAGVRALPRTVHSLGASVTAMQSEAWRLRMGYAGMVVDGEPLQAAIARLSVRF